MNRFVVYRYIDTDCKFISGQPWIGTAEQVARVIGQTPTNGGQYDVNAKTYRTWLV